MSKTRAQRAELRQKDWGSDDDTVLLPDRSLSNITAYHEDRTCPIVRRQHYDTVERTRGFAKRRWLAPCKHCVELEELPR